MPTTTSAAGAEAAAEKDSKLGEDAPTDAINLAAVKKQPPPEKPEEIRMRSFVLFSFWAIIIFLGLPIWWKTTTIYRADLPLDEMMEWADGRVSVDIRYMSVANACIGMSASFPSPDIYTSRFATRK